MNATINVPRELVAMEKMGPGGLRARYRELFDEESRSGNRQWLFRRCAWRLQSLAEGGLSERALGRARELARDVDIRLRPPSESNMPPMERLGDVTRTVRGRIGRTQDARLPAPGTILKRKYKGHVYQVEILDNGIFYDGEVYRSLSAVTHAITGGHWNGFLFFGLTASKEQA
jgi:hypothetical protein